MAILEVLRFPDERLRTVAKEVIDINDETREIVSDMMATMYDENGIGLAATQVNIHQRIVVIDVSEEGNEPLVLINPEIIKKRRQKKSVKKVASRYLTPMPKLTVLKQSPLKHLMNMAMSMKKTQRGYLLCVFNMSLII
jgi:hypothetical protein